MNPEKKDDYNTFYKHNDKCLTLGIHEDYTDLTKIVELLRFKKIKVWDEQIS